MEDPREELDLDPADENLARLTARGLTVSAMAGRLNLSARSVNRRLARLRERLGVASTAELAVELARRGF
jgi:DNA-binding CsgD family transcriptional regulator